MKTVLYLVLGLLGACVLTSCASTDAARDPRGSGRPVRLQLVVEVPPTMNILREEEVEDAFAYRFATALREQGLRGRIRFVETGEKPDPTVPVLSIFLHEWRVDRIGSVDCTFNATLTSPNGTRNLGIFSGTSLMMWSRRDWFARSEGFESAARDALSNLGQRILQSGLMPDWPQSRRL
jgi:hypothetical protein